VAPLVNVHRGQDTASLGKLPCLRNEAQRELQIALATPTPPPFVVTFPKFELVGSNSHRRRSPPPQFPDD